jgi:phosphoribosylaminoimidazolecarboxamide formyltransferase / IMP cyclohydrolase
MRALLSVYDKRGLNEFARGLANQGFEFVSTGGTLRELRAAGLPVISIADVTRFPEILDGRVKTLHPAIHGGLLARHADAAHEAELDVHGIKRIDLVAGNLYPFSETVQDPAVSLHDALEQIDIGGPAMVRAAAKNFPAVIVVVDPADYESVLEELRRGEVPLERRRALAAKAFAHISAYDAVVGEYLRGATDDDPFPSTFSLAGKKASALRYGENPGQRAAAYRRLSAGSVAVGVLDAVQLGGKELSFNNLLDADAAWSAAWTFSDPTVAIVKHTIPCGLASRPDLADAFDAALAGDPVSAFGGIVAANRPIGEETARRIGTVHFDIVIAPRILAEARDILGKKRQLRLLELDVPPSRQPIGAWDVRPIRGGFLLQDTDDAADDPSTWHVVTERTPEERERADLAFAWGAVRHVKSNAIVIARENAVVGVGSGQPNRVESVRIAARRAGVAARGAALASDAYFPFPDGIELAAEAGVTAIIQPGGSIRDPQCVEAANRLGLTMLFTGVRHFRH